MVDKKKVVNDDNAAQTNYRRLFESAKDGILLLDAVTGQITDVNPFLIDLLGYTEDEFLDKFLWEIGPFKDIVASKAAFQELREKKYIRYDELPLQTKDGKHIDVEFVSNLYEANGSKVIQCNIRDISERVLDKKALHKANEDLSALVVELKQHDIEMQQVNRMNDLLQACKTKEEAYQVVLLTAGELFTGQSGGLAILSESGHYLEVFAQWGNKHMLESIFSMEDCWAMRRGQAHEVTDPNTSVICKHFTQPPLTGYMCLPLVVQGETLGLFYLEKPAGMQNGHALGWRQLALSVGEGIKLSLSNLKLRELMREQATHDPLTGLFNRRYLNENLPRELNHAHRQNAVLSVVMIDIDHFKRFNDKYGHDAGDRMLCELSQLLSANVRESDTVCRFGGEEFVLVLLDSTMEASRLHLKKICALVKDLKIQLGEQLLGTMTLSVGIVESSDLNLNAEEMLSAADRAMFIAKRNGRDRIVVYQDIISDQEIKKEAIPTIN